MCCQFRYQTSPTVMLRWRAFVDRTAQTGAMGLRRIRRCALAEAMTIWPAWFFAEEPVAGGATAGPVSADPTSRQEGILRADY